VGNRIRAAAVAVVLFGVAIGVPTMGGAATALQPKTPIQHIVVIVQENHTFDNYFADYCGYRLDAKTKRPVCDGGPPTYPGTTTHPVVLDDTTNAKFDPNHEQVCEVAEINAGAMDAFLTAPRTTSTCGDARNFAYAAAGSTSPVGYYQQLATKGALADRYFQSVAGQSTSNDMYLWTTRFEFADNAFEPNAVGAQCSTTLVKKRYDDVTDPEHNRNLGHTLTSAGVSWAWYGEGYDAMQAAGSGCPTAPAECPIAPLRTSPCVYDPADMPSQFFASSVDHGARMRDYSRFAADLASNRLPSVVFVKAVGYKTEHPGLGQQLSPGVGFVRDTINAVEHSKAAKHTLVLLTYDEGGGYYDHVPPPPNSSVDGQPYGPRIPAIAVGPFARAGAVSHTQLEHASIVRFIEWNWLAGKTGQLGGRDATAHNLGSLLEPTLGVPN
jgi:phospholipase C